MHSNPIFPNTPESFRKKVQQTVAENMKAAEKKTALTNVWHMPAAKKNMEGNIMRHLMDVETNNEQTGTSANSKHGWRKKAIASAIVIAIVGAGGFSVHAVVKNMAEQRMEHMPEEEKKTILDEVDSQTANATTYSRELTQEEEARKEELAIAYKNGQFPENELLKVEDESQIDKERLCYVTTTAYMALPDRELTDEEILQILDDSYKKQYALKERTDKMLADELQAQKEEQQKLEAEVKENSNSISKEEAISIAEKYLNELFGKTAEGMDIGCYVTTADDFPEGSPEAGPGDKPFYVVTYYIDYIDQYVSYVFHISTESNIPFYVLANDGFHFEDPLSISEANENIQTMYQMAEDCLQNFFDISDEYKEVYCSYDQPKNEESVLYNEVGFWFTTDTGTTYKVVIDCKNMRVVEFGVESFDKHLKQCDEARELSPEEMGETTSIKLK